MNFEQQSSADQNYEPDVSRPMPSTGVLGRYGRVLVVGSLLPILFLGSDENSMQPQNNDCRSSASQSDIRAAYDIMAQPGDTLGSAGDVLDTRTIQRSADIANSLGLIVSSPTSTLAAARHASETLSKDAAADENVELIKTFTSQYGVKTSAVTRRDKAMQEHNFSAIPATEVAKTMRQPAVQIELGMILATLATMPLQYIRDTGLTDIKFARASKENQVEAFAGKNTIYFNTNMILNDPFVVAHEIGHLWYSKFCGKTLDQQSINDPQLNTIVPKSAYSNNSLKSAPLNQIEEDNAGSTPSNAPFVSRYASTFPTENAAVLLSCITLPKGFKEINSDQYPVIRNQAAILLGRIYKKDPAVAKYFGEVGSRN